MSREEEIKARLEKAQVNASSYPVTMMDADIAHLLARNEKLRRRGEKMEAVVDAARFDRKELHHPECKCHFCSAVDALDAKEQDDDI